MSDNEPQFPLYIPSKSRSQYMHTSKALTAMGVSHFIVVEPQQVDEYKASAEEKGLLAKILPLDMSYKDVYEKCDDLGLTKSTGPGPARNFAWDHSISNGYGWHWVMDDNINWFYRYNRNQRIRCASPGFWRAMEDFCLRYQNVAMAGPNYRFFVPSRSKRPAFITNTRIYSCNLIRNDLPYRWRGRYNEDTILSLDMLKDNWVTVQFNAFLQDKIVTQALDGGNSQEFYFAEGERVAGRKYTEGGTRAKSEMLTRVHPDLAIEVFRYGRDHHYVDYSGFKQRLEFKPGVTPHDEPNEYGMSLRQVSHYNPLMR